jgi:GT2 family glycosyltransferase
MPGHPAFAPEDPKLLNRAVKNSKELIVLLIEPGVELLPEALDVFSKTFEKKPNAVLAFSDYKEEDEVVRLMDYNGDLTEGFDLGRVVALRRDAVLNAGGFDERLKHAHLYDLRLRLLEAGGEIVHVNRVLYSFKRPKERSAPEGLLSDSFDYLFYDPEAEKEYEVVFKEMLKRRGGYLDHQNEVVLDDRIYDLPVSVVIPVRNRERFIGTAIESVLSGTFQDFELLVVDNASEDGTRDVARRIVDRDPRVRLIENPVGSISFALNTGLRAARGKYLAQLDSDDEYLPDTLIEMVRAIEANPRCGLAISYYEVMDEAGDPIPDVPPIQHLEYDRNNILRVGGAGAVRVYRTCVLRELGGFDEGTFGNFAEDYDMVLRISECYDVDRVHRVLYRYRRHPKSADAGTPGQEQLRLKTLARSSAIERRRELNLRLKTS